MSRFLNILLSYNVTLISLNPDSAPVLAIKILYHDKFLTSLAACTATLHQCSFIKICKVTQYQSLSSFVPRHSYRPESLYHDAKNRAMLRSFRLVAGTLPRFRDTAPAFIRSATQTPFIAGPLANIRRRFDSQ